jgi:exodeoxyribonuclease V beta subunit
MNLDLNRHAVLEASAGTGKTRAIEELVLRLVCETGTPLEQILVVTFTEKATGDLKSRLRAALERALSGAARGRADLLQQALDEFDQAPIFTIHGFCQRLLKDYPLEKGHDFSVQLVNDADLLEEALRDVQRRGWRRDFGPRLAQVLDWADLRGARLQDWENRVRAVACSYRPACGHRLLPEPPADWNAVLSASEAPDDFDLWLASHTIARMHEQLAELKRRRGGQSFDDMLTRVRDALDPQLSPQADRLLPLLRQRYRCGIVDEFQDTDPVQWDIFRRIFLEGERSRLFVVGDPKQAIYGFRGADLPTYQRAVREMVDCFGAQTAPLETNWRSTPELLQALNAVFDQGQFFPPADEIVYHPVRPPKPAERNLTTERDLTGRGALTIVDVNDCGGARAARGAYAEFIAQEVVALLTGAEGRPALTLATKHGTRPLHAGDIGVLVFRRREANELVERLRRAGVPWTFYKEGSLWKSRQARHVLLLLQALADPQDLASLRLVLLTEFFGLSAEELGGADEIPLQHPARQLFHSWLGWAEAGAWGDLFASLLEQTGLLAAGDDDLAAERRLANDRALFAALQQEAYGDNLDLAGLIGWLRRKIETAPDEDQQPIDTDRPKVNILTIHASKGLEFPVVFLAGGFTAGKGGNEPLRYRDAQGRIVFDLSGAADPRGKADKTAEARRLLYVALTRAMVKLYVPLLDMAKYMQAAPTPSLLAPALGLAVSEMLGPPIATRIPWSGAPELPVLAACGVGEPLAPAAAPDPVLMAIDPSWAKKRLAVRSFSSLRRPVEPAQHFGPDERRHQDEPPETPAAPDPFRGVVFGDLVHEVLEKIDFHAVGLAGAPAELLRATSAARTVLERAVARALPKLQTRTPRGLLEAACLSQVAALVWQTLHTPLAEVGGPLWRIPPAERLHELEFHYPQAAARAPAARLEEVFITGFIDLVFRARGRWFLVDWKTNFLPDYTAATMERCMHEADYHRQHQLYVEALGRWLRRKGEAAAALGGVYYLFVRGLNGQDESRGVFFHRPGARVAV